MKQRRQNHHRGIQKEEHKPSNRMMMITLRMMTVMTMIIRNDYNDHDVLHCITTLKRRKDAFTLTSNILSQVWQIKNLIPKILPPLSLECCCYNLFRTAKDGSKVRVDCCIGHQYVETSPPLTWYVQASEATALL